MRFLCAVLCVLLVAWAAVAQPRQRFVVENNCPRFVVVSAISARTLCACGTTGSCYCDPARCGCPNCYSQPQPFVAPPPAAPVWHSAFSGRVVPAPVQFAPFGQPTCVNGRCTTTR